MKRVLAVAVVLAVGSSTAEAAWQICMTWLADGPAHACCTGKLQVPTSRTTVGCCTVSPTRDDRGPVETRYRLPIPTTGVEIAPRALVHGAVAPLPIWHRSLDVPHAVPLHVRQISLLI
jgi:hypothetical protein